MPFGANQASVATVALDLGGGSSGIPLKLKVGLVSTNWVLVGVLAIRDLLFGVYIGAPFVANSLVSLGVV